MVMVPPHIHLLFSAKYPCGTADLVRAGSPVAENVAAACFCAFDPAIPHHVRLILIAVLAYFISRVDMIPDMLVIIGFAGDVMISTTGLAAVRSNLTETHVSAVREF